MIWRVILFWLLGVCMALADLPHAVHSANGQNYAYDRCGNMLVRGSQSLVYDPENRLIAVVASNQVTTFGYDAGGARLWKQGPTNTLQVWIDGNYEEKDGRILYHISAGDRVVCTFDASNTVFEYYHPDHLHSAEILSDNAGNLYQHYEYSAYGQSRYTLSGAAFPISRRYTSQVLDEETGLYFYASRYYDPQLGRFIQPDTIIPQEFNPQAYDRYAYALDNPFRFTDPSGHAGKEVADWWEGHVNRVYSSLTEGSESTLYLGTMGTVNSIVGGIVEPLRLGSDAGRVSVTGGTAGEVTVVVVQEGLRTISLVPVGSAIGKGGGTLLKTAIKSGEKEVAAEATSQVAAATPKVQAPAKPGPYSDLTDSPSVGPGKDYTQAQKRNILDANRQKNNGMLRSDQSGEQAVQPQQSTKGVKPPDNEAHVDHVQPKSQGGPNSYKNAQVLTRKENLQKSDTPPSQ